LSGLDHIFAVHFKPTAISTKRFKSHEKPPVWSHNRLPPLAFANGLQSYKSADQLNTRSTRMDEHYPVVDLPQLGANEPDSWPDSSGARASSSALLSYLSVQTQAMDLIGQLLWMTARKKASDQDNEDSNNKNRSEIRHIISVSNETKSPPIVSPLGENLGDNECKVNHSNSWLSQSGTISPVWKHTHNTLNVLSPHRPTPHHPSSTYDWNKRTDRCNRKPQIGSNNEIAEIEPKEDQARSNLSQPFGAGVNNLLCLFRNCSPLLSSHPVRSLLPAELASKVDSFKAAKLCHLCLKEFPDEMSVLRHQVKSHSLEEEPPATS
uniref:C2H2-type domain-containing protein n=1 Tax=Echinostoma caproni TaxID=27848 RepID=A0A183AHL1_9TREM